MRVCVGIGAMLAGCLFSFLVGLFLGVGIDGGEGRSRG